MKEVNVKIIRHEPKKPWLTSSLVNACHKNNLYRLFLKHRTITTENIYKLYKNKLTAVLRCAKKKYYCAILLEPKNNFAGTWRILRTIIGKVQKKHEYPEQFINNDKFIGTKENTANMFNEFFTNVGPDLAKNITTPVGI